MARKPWWEWDAAELKHSTEVPAGYSIDYYEKPHGNDVWRKYLIDGSRATSRSPTSAKRLTTASRRAWRTRLVGSGWTASAIFSRTQNGSLGPWVPTRSSCRSRPQVAQAASHRCLGREGRLGTAVHDALEHLCAGTVPSLADFDAGVRPYIKAICAWFADNDPHVLHTEMLVGSREWKYAGRFDLLYEQNGKRVLADLKTSAKVIPVP
jgi:hypothetical protein